MSLETCKTCQTFLFCAEHEPCKTQNNKLPKFNEGGEHTMIPEPLLWNQSLMHRSSTFQGNNQCSSGLPVGPKQNLYVTHPVKRLIRLHMGMSKPASRDEFVFCLQYCSAQNHSFSDTFLIRECHAVVTGARRALTKLQKHWTPNWAPQIESHQWKQATTDIGDSYYCPQISILNLINQTLLQSLLLA
jgi:hypothetical protein